MRHVSAFEASNCSYSSSDHHVRAGSMFPSVLRHSSANQTPSKGPRSSRRRPKGQTRRQPHFHSPPSTHNAFTGVLHHRSLLSLTPNTRPATAYRDSPH